MVEWTGRQQLLFLLQSGGVGFLLGLLFDILTAVGRVGCRRWRQFLLDALFGIPAALITFFGALSIMDGELHPLLFVGIIVGLLAEHASLGKLVTRVLCAVMRWHNRFWRRLLDGAEGVLLQIPVFFRWFWGKIHRNRPADEKNHKKSRFFQKKT